MIHDVDRSLFRSTAIAIQGFYVGDFPIFQFLPASPIPSLFPSPPPAPLPPSLRAGRGLKQIETSALTFSHDVIDDLGNSYKSGQQLN